jgi:hypothetical protein
MRVPRNRHSRIYFHFHVYRHMPGIGPSICERIVRLTPGTAGGAPCADASDAMNPVTAQIAQDAKPVKPLRVSMTTSLPCPDRQRPNS